MPGKMKPIIVLKTFFGYKPGQQLKDFAEELRKLSPEEKSELVALAAKELGVELDLS